MKKNSLFSIMIATVILFSSCATTVSVKKIQPANFDIKNAKSIAILPFETSEPSSLNFSDNINLFLGILDAIVSYDSAINEQKYIVSYLEDKIADGVIESNHFQLIDGRAVKSALSKGLPSPADIYIVGYIHNFESDIDKDYEKDEEDGEVEVSYQRKVSYNISYQVINAKTHVVLGNKQEYVSGYSSRTSHRHNLESAFDITQSRINSVARKVIYNIQPHTVSMSYTLLKDKSDILEMELANEYAKNGNLQGAKETFLEVYEETGLFEAGYNAAILMQALEEYYDAERLMQELVDRTYDKQAVKALSSIKKEMKAKAKVSEQLDSDFIN